MNLSRPALQVSCGPSVASRCTEESQAQVDTQQVNRATAPSNSPRPPMRRLLRGKAVYVTGPLPPFCPRLFTPSRTRPRCCCHAGLPALSGTCQARPRPIPFSTRYFLCSVALPPDICTACSPHLSAPMSPYERPSLTDGWREAPPRTTLSVCLALPRRLCRTRRHLT